MFANEQFFLYMLSKGYIYKDIKPLDDELPKSFITKIKEVVNSFDIPSRYVEQVEYYKETTTPIINAFGEEDILPDAEKIIRDILPLILTQTSNQRYFGTTPQSNRP